MRLAPLQGISDAIAFAYVEAHGGVRWADVEEALEKCNMESAYPQ